MELMIILLGPEQISDLTELLVQHAHKWRFIGIALRFQPQDLDNIQACSSLDTGLHQRVT